MTTNPLSPFPKSPEEKPIIEYVSVTWVYPEGNFTSEFFYPAVKRVESTAHNKAAELVIAIQPDGTISTKIDYRFTV